MTSVFEPAPRFVLAQSWWVASEVARRNPRLLVIETHPGGGQYDCLDLIELHDSGGWTQLAGLNRTGRIHVMAHGVEPIPWAVCLSADGGHDVVRRIERATSLALHGKAPATTPRTLSYRILARVLASLVDDRHAWDARNGICDGVHDSARPELQRFPTVVEGLCDSRPDDVCGVSAYRYWMLLRDKDPVAVLDVDGRAHFPDRGPVELLPAYRRAGSSLTATIGTVLGDRLP